MKLGHALQDCGHCNMVTQGRELLIFYLLLVMQVCSNPITSTPAPTTLETTTKQGECTPGQAVIVDCRIWLCDNGQLIHGEFAATKECCEQNNIYIMIKTKCDSIWG